MISAGQRWFDRGERVRCSKTLIASHDGKAITGPAISGVVFDDEGEAHIFVRAADGKLHAAYRTDVSTHTDAALDRLRQEGLL